MSKLLTNGYYKVTAASDGDLHVVLRAGNNKTLSQTETIGSWDNVRNNILAQIRANNGKSAVMVDATGRGANTGKTYYRIILDAKVPRGYRVNVISNADAYDAQVDGDETFVAPDALVAQEQANNIADEKTSF